MLPFFLPNGVVNAYSWLARFGSPLFLLIQMVILLVRACGPACVWPCSCSSRRTALLCPTKLAGVHRTSASPLLTPRSLPPAACRPPPAPGERRT